MKGEQPALPLHDLTENLQKTAARSAESSARGKSTCQVDGGLGGPLSVRGVAFCDLQLAAATLHLEKSEHGGQRHLRKIAAQGFAQRGLSLLVEERVAGLAQTLGHFDQRTYLRHHFVETKRLGELNIRTDVEGFEGRRLVIGLGQEEERRGGDGRGIGPHLVGDPVAVEIGQGDVANDAVGELLLRPLEALEGFARENDLVARVVQPLFEEAGNPIVVFDDDHPTLAHEYTLTHLGRRAARERRWATRWSTTRP